VAVDLVLTKADLLTPEQRLDWQQRLTAWGYAPLLVSAHEGEGMEALRQRLSQPRTAAAPAAASAAVLLLGDSFILGAGLADTTSLGWQLQSLLPQRRVANYAGGGFGTIHQLLLLRDATGPRRLIPTALAEALRGGDPLHLARDMCRDRGVIDKHRTFRHAGKRTIGARANLA
jgi:hypothetical protein